MPEVGRKEEYQIDTDLFVKEYLPDGTVRFWKNNQILALPMWNWEINRFQSMTLKEQHPNVLVRWKEQHRRKGFLRFINAQPGQVVADIGCESGYLAEAMVNSGCRVICVDIDPALLQLAQSRIGTSRAEYIVSNIQAISLSDARVDIAVASEIIEHLPRPEIGLQELIRITKPGGYIFLSVPNEPLVLTIKRALRALHLARSLGSLSPDLAIGHVHVFGKRELLRVCNGHSDVIVRQTVYHLPLCLNVFACLQKHKS